MNPLKYKGGGSDCQDEGKGKILTTSFEIPEGI